MPKPEGGYAFPVPSSRFEDEQSRYSSREQSGMTLRQWYAGIIQVSADELPSSRHGCADFLGMADDEYDGLRDYPKVVAKYRFLLADAMIAESEKNV